jgi:hypothetical protein
MDLGYYEIGADFEDEDYDLEEMLGEFDDDGDDYELVGRSRRRRRASPRGMMRKARGILRKQKAKQEAVVAKQLAASTLVRQSSPSKSREQALGFDSVTTVAAAASANVSSSPQVVFRPDRLVVSGAIAPSFLVTDIKIGRASQLISSDALPAEAFSNLSVGVGMKMDTAQISQNITLSVTNISAGALRFTAALIGPVVDA